MEDSEKKRVSLMGTPRVTAWVRPAGGRVREEPQRISQDAGAMELLALLLLTRRFVTHADAKVGGEVRRDWLLANMTPQPGDTPKQTRDNLLYRLKKLDARLTISAARGKREMGVFKMTLDNLSVDVLELAEAAQRLHVPDHQEKVIALADRPLLDGMAYTWLQQPWFQAIRAVLDSHYLTALHHKADSLLVQRESANEAGRLADADACRAGALPLLDKAAERLRGYGERLGQPEYAALLPFESQFSDLRRRAAYPLPDAAAPVAGPPPSRIRRPLTRFVGREQEKQRLQSLLTTERLVTLTGLGGCGKTRLALEVADEIEENGRCAVRLVELASLGDPALLPQTVARALGLEVQENFVEALTAHFQGKPTLLLLDNCEHLLHSCAALVETLLQACPELTVLATSRQRLNIDGEYLRRIPPLGVPSLRRLSLDAPPLAATLLHYDSVRLFVDRVSPHRDFDLTADEAAAVAAICESLDGIPLALELAAARARTRTMKDVAALLADRFSFLTDGRRLALPRHKTLRAVLDWSYDLLTETEQALLCRLSVFQGGWTPAAAEAVCTSEGTPPPDVLDLLDALEDKSLITADLTTSPSRCRMLETVRQYAQDRLRERGEWEETRRRHRGFFYQFSRQANPQLHGPHQAEWHDRVEKEHDNLRAALDCYQQAADDDDEWLCMAAALWWFWWVRGYLTEGRSRLAAALSNETNASADARSRALEGAGVLATFQGDYQTAQAFLEEGLALAEQLGKKAGMASAFCNLGIIAEHQGRYRQAQDFMGKALELQRCLGNKEQIAGLLEDLGGILKSHHEFQKAEANYQESLAIRREIGDTRGFANSLEKLGEAAFDRGEYDHAQEAFRESLALHVQLGNKRGIASSWANLGKLAQVKGDYEAARKSFEDSVTLFREVGDRGGTAHSLFYLAALASDEGRQEEAGKLYEESLTLFLTLGDKDNVADVLIRRGNIARQQCNYGEARRWLRRGLDIARELEDQLSLAYWLEASAFLLLVEGQPTQTARLLGTSGMMIEQFRYCRPQHEIGRYDEAVAETRDALSKDQFTTFWAEGRAMTWEQAAALALGEGAEET